MIDYTLGSLSGRLDTNFLTSCWLPAFFAVLANLGMLTVRGGPDALAGCLDNLDAFAETIVVMIMLVIITMVGLLVRALIHDRRVLRRRAIAPRRDGVCDSRPIAGLEPCTAPAW